MSIWGEQHRLLAILDRLIEGAEYPHALKLNPEDGPELAEDYPLSGCSSGASDTACCTFSIASSRSLSTPVHSNRARKGFPRLLSRAGFLGSPSGVSDTTCCPFFMASSRSLSTPICSYRR